MSARFAILGILGGAAVALMLALGSGLLLSMLGPLGGFEEEDGGARLGAAVGRSASIGLVLIPVGALGGFAVAASWKKRLDRAKASSSLSKQRGTDRHE